MQTASSRVSGNGCNIYEGSVRVPPASPTPRNARREAGPCDEHACQHHGSCSPNASVQRTDRQTDWHPVLDAFRFSASSSSTEVRTSRQLCSVNFQPLPAPGGNTHEKQVETSAQSGKELSSSACTDKGTWSTGVSVKKQRPPCPSASCWEKGGIFCAMFLF